MEEITQVSLLGEGPQHLQGWANYRTRRYHCSGDGSQIHIGYIDRVRLVVTPSMIVFIPFMIVVTPSVIVVTLIHCECFLVKNTTGSKD